VVDEDEHRREGHHQVDDILGMFRVEVACVASRHKTQRSMPTGGPVSTNTTPCTTMARKWREPRRREEGEGINGDVGLALAAGRRAQETPTQINA